MSRPPFNDDPSAAGHAESSGSGADPSSPSDPEVSAAGPRPAPEGPAAPVIPAAPMDPSARAAWPPPQGAHQQPGPGRLPPVGPYGSAPARDARPFRRGFGLGAGAGLGFAASLVALGVIGFLISAIALVSAPPTGPLAGSYEGMETVWGDPGAAHTLRAIPVSGVIMADESDGMGLTAGTYGYEVARVIDGLTEQDADGLVLLMNTPGGSITGSRAIADAVDRYRERTGNQVFAHVQGVSASGGMYAMANADRIIADHGSLVGSIGVISGPFSRVRDVTGTSGTLFEQGVTTEGGITYEYLSMGRDKDFGNPYRDMTAEEREVWMGVLSTEYDAFVSWVAEHRGIPAETIREEYGAHMFGSEAAVANGYVDAVGGQDEAYRDFATRAGLDPDDTQLVQAVPPSLWETLLGFEARTLGTAPAAEPQGNAPAHATARICTGTPQALAVHGDLSAFCG